MANSQEELNELLLKSARYGNIDNVQYALDHGADINCRSSDVYERTPIQLALEYSHVNVIELLLNKGTKVASEDWNELLLKSAGYGNIVTVQYALDHGADINCSSSDGYQRTPIQCALERGHLDVFKFLLNEGAKVTSEYLNEFLLKSARHGNIDTVQYALDHGADINCRSSDTFQLTPIQWALEHRHSDVSKFLLDKGAKVTSEDWNNFLWMSVTVCNIDNIQYALDHGADINCIGITHPLVVI